MWPFIIYFNRKKIGRISTWLIWHGMPYIYVLYSCSGDREATVCDVAPAMPTNENKDYAGCTARTIISLSLSLRLSLSLSLSLSHSFSGNVAGMSASHSRTFVSCGTRGPWADYTVCPASPFILQKGWK